MNIKHEEGGYRDGERVNYISVDLTEHGEFDEDRISLRIDRDVNGDWECILQLRKNHEWVYVGVVASGSADSRIGLAQFYRKSKELSICHTFMDDVIDVQVIRY